ncbi:MAG: hypothetical protein FWC41_00540 [Firmicutes bacterium]|nr:hypothetical protein [Bacillota bacterium]
MTYKQFERWCNERTVDGCWGMDTAIMCIEIIESMRNFIKEECNIFNESKKVEMKWQEMWNEKNSIIKNNVEHCNIKRKELL